jgi:hypothetical protein
LPQCHYSTELPELLDNTELSKRVIECVRVTAAYPSSSTITPNHNASNCDSSVGDGVSNVAIVSSGERESLLTAVALSKRWGITLEDATATIDASTQSGVRNVFSPSERKVWKEAPWLEFPSIKGEISADSRVDPYTRTDFDMIASTHGSGRVITLIP